MTEEANVFVEQSRGLGMRGYPLPRSPKSPSMEKRQLEHKIDVENKQIDNTWKSCCGLVMDKNAVMYFTQIIIIFFVMCFAIYKLTTNDSCEAQTTYMSLLTLCIGVIAPSPTFKKK